ncbi:Lrp/AsnC family transcriptional regulator [Candidatus Woesearchaeota archaeon]|nr:Lrp/AsnC family transcriptional regulator [Candidatus Woesearchaeota archaeon]
MMIDEIDKKILNVVIGNARLSLREIAKQIGYSVVTVMNRMKRLEKEKIIKEYIAHIDYEKLGYDVNIIIKIRVSKGKLFEVEKKIAIDQHVSAVYDITGDFDSIVIAKFKTRKALDIFLKKIQTYEFVERTETILILNTIKEKYNLLL